MSYDLGLCDPLTGNELELDAPHQMKGGTYQVGGCSRAHLNVTYNYSPHLYRVIAGENEHDGGLRLLYGKTGAESIPILENAITQLADDVDDDYWEPTEGNAKRALKQLLALAQMRPDGVWRGD